MPPRKRPAGDEKAAVVKVAGAKVAKAKLKAEPEAEPEAEPKAEPKAKRVKVQGLYMQYKGSPIPEPVLTRPAGASGFKVVCWNVAGLRAFLARRGEELQRLVLEERPAVIGFSEHKLQAGTHVEEAAKLLRSLLPDYVVEEECFSCCMKQKGYSGVALIWRKDVAKLILEVKPVKLDKGVDEGRTLCMELATLFVVLCYVPNSGEGLQRLEERLREWDPRLRGYLQGLAEQKPVLLIGDLNVAHRDADIWNVEAAHVKKCPGTTPEERESFGELLAAGFVDGFASQHPEALGAFTYWSVRARNRIPNRGLRLDYALVSEGLVAGKGRGPRLLDAFHLPDFAPTGDHCPVGATIHLG